jgi:hypothetical protein
MNVDYIVNNFEPFLQHFLSTPASLVAIFIGAAGISVLTQVVKKLGKLENDKVITAVLFTLSFMTSALDYIMSTTSLPPTILGISTVFLVGAATGVYRYFVKPLTIVLRKYLEYRSQIKNKAAEYEAIDKVTSIEKAVVTEETKTDDGDTLTTSVNTPVAIPAVKPLEQKTPVVDF